jgi:tetratricopeptide (TPR) repeat protein
MLERESENAEMHLARAIELEPGYSENYSLLADVYERTAQFDRQLRALKKAAELEPRSYKNQFNLGRFYLYQDRYKEAVERLVAAVKLEPTMSDARVALAEAYTDAGQFERAVENLNALATWGDTEHFQMGTILMYQRKEAAAIPELRAAIKVRPDETYWMQLSIAQKRMGLHAQSEESIRQGLKMVEHRLVETPKNGDARAFLGYFCARLGQRDRAESEIAQALKLGPHQLDVIWMATETYEALGEREQALAVLRASAPPEMLDDLKRWPDMAELTADSRFIELTAEEAVKKEQ